MEKISHDTVELLKETSSGVQMGVGAIRDIEDRIRSKEMREQLIASRQKHERIGNKADALLREYGEDDGQPDPVARGMAWMKTNVRMAVDLSDETAADLLTDGCNMGVKSLTKYLNQYGGAAEKARSLAKELIALEEKTAVELRPYL